MARRVKSLGPEKLDEKMMKDIRRELRERPKERGGKRERIMLPELNRKAISQKILKPEDKLK